MMWFKEVMWFKEEEEEVIIVNTLVGDEFISMKEDTYRILLDKINVMRPDEDEDVSLTLTFIDCTTDVPRAISLKRLYKKLYKKVKKQYTPGMTNTNIKPRHQLDFALINLAIRAISWEFDQKLIDEENELITKIINNLVEHPDQAVVKRVAKRFERFKEIE